MMNVNWIRYGSDVTYADVGGCKEQIEKLREVVELPLLEVSPAAEAQCHPYYVLIIQILTKSPSPTSQPERFVTLGIDPPKGVLLYGPPGTGKTLCARAVANRTDATFIRVIGSELVQKYIGEGARMIRELFVSAPRLTRKGNAMRHESLSSTRERQAHGSECL